jgi:hypothetical protein
MEGLVKIKNYPSFQKFFKRELKLNICNWNPKIHTRSCVYTSIDNEARKKITQLKAVKIVSIRTPIVFSSKKTM